MEAWARAEQILDLLLDEAGAVMPESDAVRRALEGEPEAVRLEVESLLPHLHQQRIGADLGSSTPHLLEGLAADGGLVVSPQRAFAAGDELGAYRLVDELGRGGMGVVFLAERADRQFEKRVALKIVEAPTLRPEARRRFLRERQILAELEHPSIARLLDGGVADDGTPFLVMELVEGEPIDVFCDRTGASVDRRLELFLEVCEAVRAAHDRLIVHRDIKPPNVLVDGEGRVRLLDFGIAGLVEESEALPMATVTHAFTPEYASPEQVRLERATPASDVYSLGVLLYVLLAERLPYETHGLRPAEVERLICETDPPPPSAALSGGTRADRSRARRLRGDLDHIVSTALAKDRNHRYPSAAELARDLRRHLRGLPVEARRATLGYRAQRFVSRHRLPVAAACAVVLSLAVGLAVAASQAARASKERDLARAQATKAGAVSDFLTKLFAEANPFESEEPTARDLLARGEDKITTELADHPAARAELLVAIAGAYRGLGEYRDAQRLTGEALHIQRSLHPEPDVEVAEALLEHGISWTTAGDRQRGSEFVREALEVLRACGAEVSELGARAHRSLANNADEADVEVAARHLERALEIERSIRPGESVTLALLLHDLAVLRERQGRNDEGLALKLEALEMIEPRVDPGAPVVSQMKANLAVTLGRRGRFEEAIDLQRSALAGLEARLGADHPSLLSVLTSSGKLLMDAGRFADAAAPIERAVSLGERLPGDRFDVIGARVNLATLRREQGRLDESVRLYRSTLQDFASLGVGSRTSATARVESLLGATLLRAARPEEARQRLRRALEIQERSPGMRPTNTAESRAALGEALCSLGQVERGRSLVDRSCPELAEGFGPGHWQSGACAVRRAACAARAGDREAALQALSAAEGPLGRWLDPATYWPTRLDHLRRELSGDALEAAAPTGAP